MPPYIWSSLLTASSAPIMPCRQKHEYILVQEVLDQCHWRLSIEPEQGLGSNILQQVKFLLQSSANPVLASYDIVAVEPTNARTFTQACTSLEVDLIALNLGSRRSFRFRQQDVRAAIDVSPFVCRLFNIVAKCLISFWVTRIQSPLASIYVASPLGHVHLDQKQDRRVLL